MRNTFRYALTQQDYLNFEKSQYRRANLPSFFFISVVLIATSLYYYIKNNNKAYLIGVVSIVVIWGIFMACNFAFGFKYKVNKYIACDKSYLSQVEVTITDNTIETNNLPNQNEAGIVAIYPYSIMNRIIEDENYIYFYLGFEVKILPKSAVPQEMKQQVFSQIRRNQNYVKLK
jgi:hypothetical protein